MTTLYSLMMEKPLFYSSKLGKGAKVGREKKINFEVP